jgi:hypothetical protein
MAIYEMVIEERSSKILFPKSAPTKETISRWWKGYRKSPSAVSFE